MGIETPPLCLFGVPFPFGGCMGRRKATEMTPAQKEIYVVIDEWWKTYGFGPSVKDVMYMTGEKGEGNVHRKMKKLVELGYCKGLPNRPRTIRPAYMRVRDIV